MARVKRDSIDSVQFVSVFEPMAKQGKTALEIGHALGLQGDAEKVAQYVSVKASQLRAGLKKLALAKAAEGNLSDEDTEQLVTDLVNKLPRLRGAGRPGRTATVMNDVLAQLEKLNAAD